MEKGTHLLVCWLHAGHEHPVPVHELHKRVADGVASPADPDGLHHSRVPQLPDTQFPVEQLGKLQDLLVVLSVIAHLGLDWP